MSGAIALVSARPYIFDMDSCMPTQLRESGFISSKVLSSIFERIERFFMTRSAVALTVCEALSDKIRKAAPKLPICQIEDFPLEGAGDSSERKIAELRDEFGLHGCKVILYTGNFKSYQGIELLVRAFALTKGARLLIVGSGEERSELEALVNALGVNDSVIFAGNGPLEDMGSFMALSDVLVSPRSEGENTPLKLYSYMAAKRPIVATRILSHTQVLSDKNAFLGEASPEGLAEAIALSLQDAVTANKKAELAYELVRTRYSRESFETKLLALYDGLLGNNLGEQINHYQIADDASVDSSQKIVGNDS